MTNRKTEIEVKYTNISVDKLILNLAKYVEDGFHIVSIRMEHSYSGDSTYEVEMIKHDV